jgi:hypothetical protein
VLARERAQKRARYRADDEYRRRVIEGVARWKKDNPAACLEQKRRHRLRKRIGHAPGVDLYTMTRQLRHVIGNGAELDALASYLVSMTRSGDEHQPS